MGKGDHRSRRGKIFKGSYGRTRPHQEKKPAEGQKKK
jgi:30S ribosomal protein S31